MQAYAATVQLKGVGLATAADLLIVWKAMAKQGDLRPAQGALQSMLDQLETARDTLPPDSTAWLIRALAAAAHAAQEYGAPAALTKRAYMLYVETANERCGQRSKTASVARAAARAAREAGWVGPSSAPGLRSPAGPAGARQVMPPRAERKQPSPGPSPRPPAQRSSEAASPAPRPVPAISCAADALLAARAHLVRGAADEALGAAEQGLELTLRTTRDAALLHGIIGRALLQLDDVEAAGEHLAIAADVLTEVSSHASADPDLQELQYYLQLARPGGSTRGPSPRSEAAPSPSASPMRLRTTRVAAAIGEALGMNVALSHAWTATPIPDWSSMQVGLWLLHADIAQAVPSVTQCQLTGADLLTGNFPHTDAGLSQAAKALQAQQDAIERGHDELLIPLLPALELVWAELSKRAQAVRGKPLPPLHLPRDRHAASGPSLATHAGMFGSTRAGAVVEATTPARRAHAETTTTTTTTTTNWLRGSSSLVPRTVRPAPAAAARIADTPSLASGLPPVAATTTTTTPRVPAAVHNSQPVTAAGSPAGSQISATSNSHSSSYSCDQVQDEPQLKLNAVALMAQRLAGSAGPAAPTPTPAIEALVTPRTPSELPSWLPSASRGASPDRGAGSHWDELEAILDGALAAGGVSPHALPSGSLYGSPGRGPRVRAWHGEHAGPRLGQSDALDGGDGLATLSIGAGAVYSEAPLPSAAVIGTSAPPGTPSGMGTLQSQSGGGAPPAAQGTVQSPTATSGSAPASAAHTGGPSLRPPGGGMGREAGVRRALGASMSSVALRIRTSGTGLASEAATLSCSTGDSAAFMAGAEELDSDFVGPDQGQLWLALAAALRIAQHGQDVSAGEIAASLAERGMQMSEITHAALDSMLATAQLMAGAPQDAVDVVAVQFRDGAERLASGSGFASALQHLLATVGSLSRQQSDTAAVLGGGASKPARSALAPSVMAANTAATHSPGSMAAQAPPGLHGGVMISETASGSASLLSATALIRHETGQRGLRAKVVPLQAHELAALVSARVLLLGALARSVRWRHMRWMAARVLAAGWAHELGKIAAARRRAVKLAAAGIVAGSLHRADLSRRAVLCLSLGAAVLCHRKAQTAAAKARAMALKKARDPRSKRGGQGSTSAADSLALRGIHWDLQDSVLGTVWDLSSPSASVVPPSQLQRLLGSPELAARSGSPLRVRKSPTEEDGDDGAAQQTPHHVVLHGTAAADAIMGVEPGRRHPVAQLFDDLHLAFSTPQRAAKPVKKSQTAVPGARPGGSSAGSPAVRSPSRKLTLLDSRTSQNMNIGLSRLGGNANFALVAQSIDQGDVAAIGGGDVLSVLLALDCYDGGSAKTVKNWVDALVNKSRNSVAGRRGSVAALGPNATKAAKVRAALSRVGPAERFLYYVVSELQAPKPKMEAMLLMERFDECEAALMSGARSVQAAANAVCDSEHLATFLRDVVLPLGNALNAGSRRGAAVGLRLSSLSALSTARTTKSGTLLEYVVDRLDTAESPLVKLPEEFDVLKPATSVSLGALEGEASVLWNEMSVLSSKCGWELSTGTGHATAARDPSPGWEVFADHVGPFLASAMPAAHSCKRALVRAKLAAERAAAWLGEPGADPETVFKQLHGFMQQFAAALRTVRGKRARAAAAAASLNRKSKAMVRKPATTAKQPRTRPAGESKSGSTSEASTPVREASPATSDTDESMTAEELETARQQSIEALMAKQGRAPPRPRMSVVQRAMVAQRKSDVAAPKKPAPALPAAPTARVGSRAGSRARTMRLSLDALVEEEPSSHESAGSPKAGANAPGSQAAVPEPDADAATVSQVVTPTAARPPVPSTPKPKFGAPRPTQTSAKPGPAASTPKQPPGPPRTPPAAPRSASPKQRQAAGTRSARLAQLATARVNTSSPAPAQSASQTSTPQPVKAPAPRPALQPAPRPAALSLKAKNATPPPRPPAGFQPRPISSGSPQPGRSPRGSVLPKSMMMSRLKRPAAPPPPS